MEDMDDVRKNIGTVADFSNWEGIKTNGGLKSMKMLSKEKVIDNTEIDNSNSEAEKIDDMNEKTEEIKPMEKPKKSVDKIPAANEAIINPTELKSIAVRLLPSVDKIMSGEKYAEYCEKAIDMAFTFLKVWDLKVSIGG